MKSLAIVVVILYIFLHGWAFMFGGLLLFLVLFKGLKAFTDWYVKKHNIDTNTEECENLKKAIRDILG